MTETYSCAWAVFSRSGGLNIVGYTDDLNSWLVRGSIGQP